MEALPDAGAVEGPSATALTSPSPVPPAPAPDTSSVDDAPLTPEAKLRALEAKTTQWKEMVAAQLHEAASKNKKLREEVRAARAERENALHQLRVQLAEEFQERTVMQREELALLAEQLTTLREEKTKMAAAHEVELQSTRSTLKEVVRLDVETAYKRREEQWEKEKAQLQTSLEAAEKEKAQATHESDVLRLRLSRLGNQYDDLAALLQPADGAAGPSVELDTNEPAAHSFPNDAAVATRQQSAAAAAHEKQVESIKAELKSKEQHTTFLLDRAKQEHEAEKAQLLRELHLREGELQVAHTLLKQVQGESSVYAERISQAQTERQAVEQRFAGKMTSLNRELAERAQALEEARQEGQRAHELLRAAQEQVNTLEEEATMREEAFHALLLSEDNKRVVVDLQKAVQAARDEAEEWRMQYYASVAARPPVPSAVAATDGSTSEAPSAAAAAALAGAGGVSDAAGVKAQTPQIWLAQLTAKEARLETQAAQLSKKAALLDAAETKLNEMRRTMASQASLLLKQQGSSGEARVNHRSRYGASGGGAVVGGALSEGDEGLRVAGDDSDHDLVDTSPFITTAASLLPSALHGSLRVLEAQRRRFKLSGTCGLCACCFTGGGSTGAPRRIRSNVLLIVVVAAVMLAMLLSLRLMA